jgi:hypothetical protein
MLVTVSATAAGLAKLLRKQGGMTRIMMQEETRLLTIIRDRQCILLEEILDDLPELTWNQVFAMVDELSRRKMICLRRRGFEYELQAPTPSAGRPIGEHDCPLSGTI